MLLAGTGRLALPRQDQKSKVVQSVRRSRREIRMRDLVRTHFIHRPQGTSFHWLAELIVFCRYRSDGRYRILIAGASELGAITLSTVIECRV